MRKIVLPALALVAALAIAAPASAHVTAQPPEQPAGGFTVLTLRVPNEQPESTNKVEVQFPDGITSVRYQPVDGWTVDVKMEKLDEPIDDGHGGEVTEQVDTVTFSGGKIMDGQFQEFPLSFKMVEGEAGDVVYFPAVQTYENGDEAAWTEQPAEGEDGEELERPAPSVTLTAAEGGHGAAASHDKGDDDSGDEGSSKSDDDNDDEGRDNVAFGLALAAFVISLLVMFRTTMGKKNRKD